MADYGWHGPITLGAIRVVDASERARVARLEARARRAAALRRVRSCKTVHGDGGFAGVEMVGRVIWDAKIAAARAALRARVVEEWAATGGALRLPGPLALRGSQGKALAVLRRYPIKHPRGLLGVAIEGRVIRDWHLAQARAALWGRVIAERQAEAVREGDGFALPCGRPIL